MRDKLVYVEWNKNYEVGIKSIDKQHKRFVDLINQLFEAIQTDKKHSVSNIIKELSKYSSSHFALEEAYFDKFNYPYAKEHKNEHSVIKHKVTEFVKIKDKDPFKVGYSLLDLLEEWLFNHIATMDKKYVDYFKEHGIK